MAEYIEREAINRICFMDYFLVDGEVRTESVALVRDIEKLPAADVAPVVHGRWNGDTCTACKLPWKYNMVQDADDRGYFDPMPDYCPNCGAKMDGGAENGRRRGNAHAQD